MKKYITIKNGYYYRLLCVEESSRDRSIIIRQLWHLNSKTTYHTNYGSMKAPFEFHQRGCAGNLIGDSIEKNRNKFITDYDNHFQEIVFVGELPKNSIIDQPYSHDIIIDISDKKFSKYKITLFSYNRKDLLESEFDSGVVKLVELKTHKIIIGCFDN